MAMIAHNSAVFTNNPESWGPNGAKFWFFKRYDMELTLRFGNVSIILAKSHPRVKYSIPEVHT
jgi:hypothetical protein